MATSTNGHHTIAPQLEVRVYWTSAEAPVTARLELAQARELIGRLALMAPDDTGLAAAMKGAEASRLLLGLQAFHRILLERDGCIALEDVEGGLWTIPARSVNAINVRLVTGVSRGRSELDPVALQRAFAPAEGQADSR